MAFSIQLAAFLLAVFIIILGALDLTMWRIVFAVLLFIPSSAQGLISGTSYSTSGVLNLSTVCYVSIIGCCFILGKYKHLEKRVAKNIFLCSLVIILVRIAADGFDFLSNKLFDNYVVPMFLAVVMISNLKPEYIPNLLKFVYSCIFIGAIIAVIEYFYGSSVLFHDYYIDTCPWYENIYRSSQYVAFRSTSLFGHPLIGGIYYSMGVVYLLNSSTKKRNILMWFVQFAILLTAILSTNSRSALLGIGIYITYYLFNNKKIGKIFALSLLAMVCMVFIDWETLYITFFSRDRMGSSLMVRVRAISSLIDIPIISLMLGEGYNNTSALLSTLGFVGNVEISYLIILLENGIIGFIAWIGSLFVLYGKNPLKGVFGGLNVNDTINGMLFCVLFIGGMSNSFGDPGTLNYIIYILLAFSSILSKCHYSLLELDDMANRAYRRKIHIRLGRL